MISTIWIIIIIVIILALILWLVLSQNKDDDKEVVEEPKQEEAPVNTVTEEPNSNAFEKQEEVPVMENHEEQVGAENTQTFETPSEPETPAWSEEKKDEEIR